MHFLLLPAISMILTDLSFSHPLESGRRPFDYEGARKYLQDKTLGTAMQTGEPGGFWGCYLQNWGGGCKWWSVLV